MASPLLKRPWQNFPGCYLSAFISPRSAAQVQHLIGPADISAYEKKIGRKLAIVMVFLAWGEPQALTPFPRQWCQAISQQGAIPHITWEPWNFDKQCSYYRNQSIVAGMWDRYLESWAHDIKSWGQSLFLRWGHEMNSDWYPWGGQISEGGAAAYVQAYRHVVNVFRAQDVSNVVWIWGPDAATFASHKFPFEYEPYYPGDDYVDWIGFDGYNFAMDGTLQKPWTRFRDLFSDIYQRCERLNSQAPFMIGEFSSGEKGGDKALWIVEAYQDIEKQFPRIRAVTWFDQDKESHWPIDSSPEAQQAFRKAIASQYFLDKIV